MKQLQGGSALSLSLMGYWYAIGYLDLVTNELESAQRRGFAATITPLPHGWLDRFNFEPKQILP